MRKLIIVSIIFTSIQTDYSQTGWYWLNPLPTGNDIYKIGYVSSNIAYGVGDYGTVIKSYNGGVNWSNFSIAAKDRLNGFYFLNPSTGFVAGINSAIYKTSNGGFNWIKIPLTDTADFEGIVMFNSTTGVAVSSLRNRGSIFKTTDGGITWMKNTAVSLYNIIDEIILLDSNMAYIIGKYDNYPNSYNYISRTSDKGITWVELFTSRTLDFFSIQAINSRVFFAMAKKSPNYSLVKTTDGGLSWDSVATNIDYTVNLYDASFLNSSTGFCVGNKWSVYGFMARIFKTTDGGSNWSFIQLQDSIISPRTAAVFGSSNVMIAGEGGMLYRSANSGSNYTRAFTRFTSQNINDVSFINSSTGIVVCNKGEIYKTSNSGFLWQRQYIDTSADVVACKMLDANSGYICTPKNIYKTINGGINWVRVLATSTGAWEDLDAPNPDVCMVVGTSCPSVKAKTTNGGLNWTVSSGGFCGGPGLEPDFSWYTGISMPSSSKICLIGGHFYPHAGSTPIAVISSDGGAMWWQFYQGSLGGLSMYTVDFYDTLNGFVSGSYNARLKTTNGGLNWINYGSGLPYGTALFATQFASPDILYGNGGSVKSTNGGANWFDILFPTVSINNIDCISQNIVVSVGNKGRVVRTNIGGLVGKNNITSITPDKFKLFQNYPNPFNPVTRIRFVLPLDSRFRGNDNVVLKVYDILGREVITLVNEKLSPGTYEVEFDGTNYSSGVYYYTLSVHQAGSSTGDPSAPLRMTKKLVLIK